MKVLIDECLPAGLKEMLTTMGHECETVRRAGYGSKKNGELLSLAEGRWDAEGIHRRPPCKIQSHGGFVAPHAGLRRSPAHHFAGSNH